MASLIEKIPTLLDYIKSNRNYLDHNYQLLDIYNGNLKPYVDAALRSSFSDQYYNQIKERVILINVLKRLSDKSARAYVTKPERITEDKYKQQLGFIENILSIDSVMQTADVYATGLFKGYALEPFIHQGKPKLRVLPFDRFLPYSDDPVDSTNMTEFIKFMGKRTVKKGKDTKTVEIYHIYSDEEFVSIDSDGDIVLEDLESNEGINPYGVIPFVYGNRGSDTLLPQQDTDTMSLTKMIPLLLTDLSGAIMFQCFSIVYGINVDAKNLTMSPNAFWDLKSDLATNSTTPTVGTIKPEADIDKVLQFIMATFTFWLETRGIRVSSISEINGNNAASGIAKIIDEMDATEIIQKAQSSFKIDEMDLWEKYPVMYNYWVSNNLLDPEYNIGLLGSDFKVVTMFDPPSPVLDRQSEVSTVKMERDAGFISTKKAIMQLYPDLSPEQVEAQMLEIDQENGSTQRNANNELAEV